MSKIEFYGKQEQASFLEPKEEFARKTVSFELRKDCLTGHASRLLPFRRKIPEINIDVNLIDSSKKTCPFCPERLASVTPKFVPEIAPEGRIEKGEASLIPNASPYARHSWVVILCRDHFLPMRQFSKEILQNGFGLASEGIRRARDHEGQNLYSSINWNYLPESGAGLFHPHLQVVVEDYPTVSHRRVLEGLKNYKERWGNGFWDDYLSEEIRRGERYVGNQKEVHFLMAFSPLGILGELLILFAHKASLKEVSPGDWEALSEGLVRVFQFFEKKYIRSFNLSLFSGGEEDTDWVYARLCPRILIPPWNTSDINYFEKLHDEVICVVSPEEMCKELKPFFS